MPFKVKRLPRNVEAQSLAEKLAARDNRCPIPFSHDRMSEAHYWWHQIARNYHEPDPFRYSLGAFLVAARSVTLMLQKEQDAFKDFGWYREWADQAKMDPVLRWANDSRVVLVHQQSLAPHSWLELRCLDNPRQPHGKDEDPFRFQASPFECTHYYMNQLRGTDHRHYFERHWEVDTLPGRELLDACADVFDRLETLVDEAHARLGASQLSHKRDDSPRTLPCMINTLKFRVVRTSIRNGREVWKNQPKGLHTAGD